ncbi:FecR domain-containing protein [Arcobacter sp. s6]|uniref:FecR family protein n=1 Tax=Arcobacter sp. s6 TaxID=3230363 RepID=UPI0034A00774
MKKIILFLLFISNFLLANNIGKIVSFNGEATITREGESIQVDKNSIFQKNDTLNTKENTKLQILFLDNTIISVGQNSILKINDYLFEEKNTKAEFAMVKGIFRTITGKIGKIAPENFKLRTKSASIGIRGTQIVVALENNNEKIFCTEGQIEIKNNITKDSIIVNKGEFITFEEISNDKFRTKKIKKSDLKEINENLEIQENLPIDHISVNSNKENISTNTNIKNATTTENISTNTKNTTTSGNVSANKMSSENIINTENISSNEELLTNKAPNAIKDETPIVTIPSTNVSNTLTEDLDGLDNVANFSTKTPSLFFKINNSTANYIGNFPSELSSNNNLVNITGQTVAIPSDSRISMDIDFGKTANEISNGKINISDIGNGTNKILTFDGELNGKSATFSLNPTGTTQGSGGTGTLYGTTANYMKGNIDLKSTDNVEINSDFSAKKQ